MRRILSVAAACGWLAVMAATASAEDRPAPSQPAQASGILERLRDRLFGTPQPKESAATALARLGGTRLVLQADTDAVRVLMMDGLRGDVRRLLREARIGYVDLAARDVGVEVRIRDINDVPRATTALADAGDVDLHDVGDGVIRLTPTERGLEAHVRRLLEQTAAVARLRLQELGIATAGVTVDEPDRIAVLLPGVKDPTRLADLMVRRGQLEFRMIDASVDPAVALRDGAPHDAEVLYGKDANGAPYLVSKRVELSGQDIAQVSASIDSRSQEPIVSFDFTARGARNFADVTRDNVGRPFAIVLDGAVLSAPVIREPILGGHGQISGNFTVQSANELALLLRSGALPLRLTVIEQAAVEPAQK